MLLRVLGVSFIACVSGAFSVNGAQMVPKSHAWLYNDIRSGKEIQRLKL